MLEFSSQELLNYFLKATPASAWGKNFLFIIFIIKNFFT
jgi:hypothetical protein